MPALPPTATATAMDCDECHPNCYLIDNDDDHSSCEMDDLSDFVDCTADIRRAVNVNNGGTELLRDRKYEAAVKSFTSVLTILKPLAAIVEGNTTEIGDEYYPSNSDNSNPASSMPLSMNFAASNSNSSNSSSSNETSRRRRQEQTNHQEAPTVNDSGDINMTDAVASATATRRSSLSSDNKMKKDDEESLPATSSTSLPATKRVSSPPSAKKRRGYFVFRDPVEIPIESVPRTVSIPLTPTAVNPQDDPDGLSSADLFSKFIMIVMYNLALTLHLQAIEADDGDCDRSTAEAKSTRRSSSGMNRRAKRLFSRARKLYELAFEMHLDESCEDVNLLFTLALINNLGLIYDRIGEKSRSETCFGNMLSTMMYLTDSNESSNVKQWDGLLSNVMDILFFKKKIMYEVAAPAA